jgi:hypothetical protein
MVILDNSTRWNSAYDSIHRGIQLYTAISMFSVDYEAGLGQDVLSKNDWDELKQIREVLQPFKDLTIYLQSRASKGEHGSIWETLPAIELLLGHIEALRDKAISGSVMAVALNHCWSVLTKYYRLTDENYVVYAGSTLLNPTLRISYFERHWATKELAKYISVMKNHCSAFYQRNYAFARPKSSSPSNSSISIFESFLARPSTSQIKNEFELYCEQTPTMAKGGCDLIQWWWNNQNNFPTLSQMALDLLAIPAMSAECERVFSSAKKLITPARNGLQEDIIEASECLKAWWDDEARLKNEEEKNILQIDTPRLIE